MRLELFVFVFVLLGVAQACQTEDGRSSAVHLQKEEVSRDEHPRPAPPIEDVPNLLLFAKPEGAVSALPLGKAERGLALFSVVEPRRGLSIDGLRMTEREWHDVRKFTLALVNPSEDKYKQYLSILNWIKKNIKYEAGDNTAYATYRNRKAVCQGYSNLLKAMCNAIDIPAFVVNGALHDYYSKRYVGHHAWCYVYVDGGWRVADPTNGGLDFDATATSTYDDYLKLMGVEDVMLEDAQFEYSYEAEHLSVVGVKDTDAVHIVVPYAVVGYEITNFNPRMYSTSAKYVYLGDNIRAFGENGHRPQDRKPRLVQRVLVSPNNKYLEDHKGTLYERRNDSQEFVPIYLPANAKKIYLKGERHVGKNRIHLHAAVEEVIFGEGVETVGSYAIENCPNLKKVYLPNTVKVIARDAFWGSNYPVNIERYTSGS